MTELDHYEMTWKQQRDMTKLGHKKWPGSNREIWPNWVTKKMTWKQQKDMSKLGHHENDLEATEK